MVIEFLAVTVGQACEPAAIHADVQVAALDVAYRSAASWGWAEHGTLLYVYYPTGRVATRGILRRFAFVALR